MIQSVQILNGKTSIELPEDEFRLLLMVIDDGIEGVDNAHIYNQIYTTLRKLDTLFQ